MLYLQLSLTLTTYCFDVSYVLHNIHMTGTMNVPSCPSAPRVPSLSYDLNIRVQLDFLSTFLSSTLDRHKTVTEICKCVVGNIIQHKLLLTEKVCAAAGRLQGALI